MKYLGVSLCLLAMKKSFRLMNTIIQEGKSNPVYHLNNFQFSF